MLVGPGNQASGFFFMITAPVRLFLGRRKKSTRKER